MKIAILLLNNNGDILYATPVARQIKECDFPGCHLTWIVSKRCNDILQNNSFIDRLEILPQDIGKDFSAAKWQELKTMFSIKVDRGEYDKLFILQPYGENFLRYTSCIRKMILDPYPFPLKVPLQPLLSLTDAEKMNVISFIEANGIERYQNRILFEFAPSSGQSAITITEVMSIAERIVNDNSSTCIILSSAMQLKINNPNVFNVSTLSFKENAELINQCTFLIGCSSGISWLSTASFCKALPTLQYLDKNAPWFNSLKADFKINQLDTSHIIELYRFDGNLIVKTVHDCLTKGFSAARATHDQPLRKAYLVNNAISISHYFFKEKLFRNLVLFFLKNIHHGWPFVKYHMRLLGSFCLRPIKQLRRPMANG